MKKYIKYHKTEIKMIGILFLITSIVLLSSRFLNVKDSVELEKLSELIFSSLIGLITIWISGYLILIQLYKNTYPMEIIEKKFLKKVKMILIFSTINIGIGILILSVFSNFISEIYYIFLFIVNVVVVFYNTYKINKEFTVNTYVDNHFKDLVRRLEKDNITKEDIDETFKDFYNFFDECIVKDEYYVCNNISEKIEGIFIGLVEHCNKMIVQNKAEMAEYIFEKIVDSGIYQIDRAKDSKNESLIINIFEQQIKIIKLCIEIGKLDWFKKYIKKINMITKEDIDNHNYILEELNGLNMKIGKRLLKEEDEWLECFINKLYNINVSFKFAFKNTNLSYFGKILAYLMVENNEDEKNDTNKYKILIKMLEKYTRKITYTNENIEDVVIYYSIYGTQLIENGCIERTKDFLDIITSKNNRIIENEKWNEFILFYLNITMEKWPEKFGEKNRQIIIDIIIEQNMNQSCNYYSFLPEYNKIIQKEKHNNKVLDKIYNEFDELFTRLIISDNINMFYIILEILKKSIVELEKDDKITQEKFFELFIENLVSTVNIENKKFTELTISVLDDTIGELDKERKISDKFGIHIIEKIAEVAIYRPEIKEMNVINIINLLADFKEEKRYTFIISDYNRKKILYRSIYNIGISSIENDMENAVRNVSNRLGWFIINSIKNNDNIELTNYLLERTIDLLEIAKKMKISEKTIIYIMTLFTTVGTFCCKDLKYNTYKIKIFKILSKESCERVKTAVELRTKENSMWDDLLDGQTQKLTQKFLKELKEHFN